MKLSHPQSLYLNEMELHEVNRHAQTYGFIPDFNTLTFNFQKLRRMQSKKMKSSESNEMIYL